MAQPKPQPKPSAKPNPLRSVLGRLLGSPESADEIPPELKPLVETIRRAHPRADLTDVVRAYRVAEEVHRGQMRKSGEPFVTHPLGVAQILADMGMDPVTVAGALLHDSVEDTDISLEELRASFGDEVTEIIDGLTKIAKIGFRSTEHVRAENYRKMMVAMARDLRVIIIKLADRLHNLQTLQYLSVDKQELKAAETLEIYVPLANRLGMSQIKVQLEDLAFKFRYSKRYQEVVELTERREPQREQTLAAVTEQIGGHLQQAKVRAEIYGRVKNFYSIYQKMVERGVEFDDIYDLVGVRIIVDDLRDCYAALGVVHALWKPIPGRFKDYVAMPKFNMYQSLHTAVIGPEGKPLEIQIRTTAMHRMAEEGIAAHWKYKELYGKQGKVSNAPWLGEMLDVYREARDPRDFMESLRLDLFHDEVFCFTPKGDVKCLPRGACPVDFSYAIHTAVGHRTVGARVNGRLVPLDTRLESGDVVEILTTRSLDAGPKQDWLGFVKTSRARNRIRQWLTAHRREESRETGRTQFLRILRREGIAQAEMTDEVWRTLLSETRTSGAETLHEALGEGRLGTADLVAVLRRILRPAPAEPEPEPERPPLRRSKRKSETPSVVIPGGEEVLVKLAGCCTPVPGDVIFGFVTRGKGVSVHREDCPNAASLKAQPARIIDVQWDTSQGGTFAVVLQVAAIDRSGLLRDISNCLTDCGVMILSSASWAKRDGTARLRFSFELGDVTHLDHILGAVRQLDGVFDAYRVLPLQARSKT